MVADTFLPGQIVDVKVYGRAKVLEPLQNDKSKPYHGRVLIEYEDTGSHYHCRPSRMRAIKPNLRRIVVCRTTKEYRTAAVQNVRTSDTVLEVGAHVGVATAMVHRRVPKGFAVGIDTDDTALSEARTRFPQVRFEKVDGADLAAVRALSPKGTTFDKVLIDIGGIRELPTVMHMVGLYYKAFPKAQVIVKSVFLAQLLSNNIELFNMSKEHTWADMEGEDGEGLLMADGEGGGGGGGR